jgi:CDP-glucose 4,6-dehydratase
MFKYFNKKTILVTGHTGFKGSWLSVWFSQLGAKVIGFSVKVQTEPKLSINKAQVLIAKHEYLIIK